MKYTLKNVQDKHKTKTCMYDKRIIFTIYKELYKLKTRKHTISSEHGQETQIMNRYFTKEISRRQRGT